MMEPDVWLLYEHMLRSRLFEASIVEAWHAGKISGEMHTSIGEEAIVAGSVLHLQDGDAMALDHRGTAPLVMRGVDLVALCQELLGHPSGLCAGQGGHMHLFSKQHLAAASGIVGASGPAAAGFALAAQLLHPGKIALAFFGEGAMNQGMLLESINLAMVWKLPVLFICKDNQWSITTPSASMTAGDLVKRVKSFGMPAQQLEGTDVRTMWQAAHDAIARARDGGGPSFILATCFRPEGHFLGDPLLRVVRQPMQEMKKLAGPLLKSVTQTKGASPFKRTGGLGRVTALLGKTSRQQLFKQKDPLSRLVKDLKAQPWQLEALQKRVADEIDAVVATTQPDPRETET
jgi:pyruvate dehydrogenase E1 component alpha subunit